MAFVGRHIFAACGVAVLLLAVGWTAHTLRAPDPRTRAAWAGDQIVVGATPVLVELYLPGCAIAAITVHAPPTSGGERRSLAATVSSATGAQLATVARPQVVELDATGRGPILLDQSPRRERVTVALSADVLPVALDPGRPFSLARSTPSPLGLLPCAVDERPIVLLALLTVLGLGLGGIAVVGARLLAGPPYRPTPATRPWVAATLGATVGMTSVLTYLFVVPPFEPPDELAHFEYARFVAVSGTLPSAVPPPESEWRASAYEWVQQPLYYIAAATVLRFTADPQAAPAPNVHPQSRLSGGPDVNIYRHPDTTSPAAVGRAVWLLRGVSVVLAFATLWCTARAVSLATGSSTLGALGASALALVPQWGAVMGSVSTDPPATLAAAMATLLMGRVVTAPTDRRVVVLAGLVTGLAYATKVTTVFLVPMMAMVLWQTARDAGYARALRAAVAFAAGVLAGAAWVPLRAWMVFGDPLARAFKREVLAIGGFHVVEGPPLLSAAFASQMWTMVFEPFWARFGSLGAGPLPGTRLWWIYAAATLGLLTAFAVGAAWSLSALRRRPSSDERWMVLASTVGVVTGVALWAWVNLVPQADVIVHWTPRHILPLTTPLLVVVAAGCQQVDALLPPAVRHVFRTKMYVGLIVLAVAALAVWRSAVLAFHFGY